MGSSGAVSAGVGPSHAGALRLGETRPDATQVVPRGGLEPPTS